jgi:hypothetical protein
VHHKKGVEIKSGVSLMYRVEVGKACQGRWQIPPQKGGGKVDAQQVLYNNTK